MYKFVDGNEIIYTNHRPAVIDGLEPGSKHKIYAALVAKPVKQVGKGFEVKRFDEKIILAKTFVTFQFQEPSYRGFEEKEQPITIY